MKKKLLTLIMLACLLAAAQLPALAADADAELMAVTTKRAQAVRVSSALTEGHSTAPAETKKPDAAGELSFENLSDRMTANYPALQALEEAIASISVTDFEQLREDMTDNLSDLISAQWLNLSYANDTYTAQSLQQAYDALRDSYDDLREGKLQKNMAEAVRALENTEDQILMAGETLYITLQGLNQQDAQLGRQLESLDRTVQEMELRYQLGQISALQLQQVKAGRTSLASGRDTLEMNIKSLSMQMQMMVGAPITGELKLSALPEVTDAQLNAMDLEKDLARAKLNSYALLDAKNTLDDAEEQFKDDIKGHSTPDYQYVAAQHTWEAAQRQYEGTVQTFEGNFRTLYLQVKDYKQILEAAKVQLALQKDTYASVQTKYDLGNISLNTLLDAQDDVAAAEDAVRSAAVDLFSAYNNYRWAVDRGILN
jgi:outer membrane protein TolC